ncbi:MAG: ATP-binding cassette domain-containing protein [Mycobacteriales bacterium]
MTSVIRTEGLTKRYAGGVLAVDGLNLDVPQGERYGFLGPNGSGKTTTVRMLLGLVYPSAGRVELLGHPMPRAAKHALPRVGALVEGPAFVPHLSGRVNLSLIDQAGPGGGRRTRKTRVDGVLEQVGLDAIGARPVKAYSLGMRQRLGLAAALLRAPELLVLDEPTNGLDPAGIREVRDLLTALNEQGTTVFLSSHLLAEVEALCTSAAIVHRGRLVEQARVDDLLVPTGRLRVTTPQTQLACDVVAATGTAHVLEVDGSVLIVQLDGLAASDLNARLVQGGVAVDELVVERPTLEDVFLDRTGESVHSVEADAEADVLEVGRVRG